MTTAEDFHFYEFTIFHAELPGSTVRAYGRWKAEARLDAQKHLTDPERVGKLVSSPGK